MSGDWRTTPSPSDADVLFGGQPALVTLHFLRGALRRRWRICAAACLAGLLLGAGLAWHGKSSVPASVTILLAHDPGADPTTAMATDLSLVRTRSVARAVIRDLDLDMTIADFQSTVVPEALTPDLLELKVVAGDAPEATRRAAALATAYLQFREDQLVTQSEAVIAGYQSRVDELEDEFDTLTQQAAELSEGGPEQQSAATDVLNKRSLVASQATSLQQQIEDTSLQIRAIVAASDTLDPAHALSRSLLRSVILPPVTGAIAGLALGMAWVIASALVSDRLRRRDEIALAVGAPVRISVGRVRWSWWAPLRGRSRRRDLALLTQHLDGLLERRDRPERLALLAVRDPQDLETTVWALAARLAEQGREVRIVDLCQSRALTRPRDMRRTSSATAQVRMVRPGEVTTWRRDAAPARREGRSRDNAPTRASATQGPATLVVAEADTRVGMEALSSWARDAVLFVPAGASTAEELRTVSELIRTAGIRLRDVVVTRADASDTSNGRIAEPEARDGWSEVR